MTSMLNQAVRTIKPTVKETAIKAVTSTATGGGGGGGDGGGGVAFTRKLSPVVSTRLHSPLSQYIHQIEERKQKAAASKELIKK